MSSLNDLYLPTFKRLLSASLLLSITILVHAGTEHSDYTRYGSGSLSGSNNAGANNNTAIDQGAMSGDLTSTADSNTAVGYRAPYRSQASFLSPRYMSRAHFSASKNMASIFLGAMMSPTL